MPRLIIGFVLVFALFFTLFYYAIPAFKKLPEKVKWDLIKIGFYSILCAALSAITLGAVSVVF